MAENPGSRKLDEPHKKRRGIAWLLALLALLVVGGIATAVIIASDDSGDDVAEQVQDTADGGVDAVTNAGDDGLDTVTDEGDDARDGATDADTTTGGADAAAPGAVQDDPVVKRLARGRSLPFVAGPWVRASYRDTVYERLSDATTERATKVRRGERYGIRIS